MSNLFHIDHKLLAGGILAATTGWAIYTSWKLWAMKRQKHKENYTETFNYLHENLMQQYGSVEEFVGEWGDFLDERFLNMREHCVELCKKHSKSNERVLDVNCGVGRVSFELSEHFDEVLGIDPSRMCVGTCQILREKGTIFYSFVTQGLITSELSANLSPSINREKVNFRLAHASCLPLDLGSFDCVLALNLLCQLHTPLNFLNRLPELVRPSGIVVIASSYNISKNITPRENWIGGYLNDTDKTKLTVFEGLKLKMDRHFDLVDVSNHPFLMKKSDRSYSLSFCHIHVWKKR